MPTVGVLSCCLISTLSGTGGIGRRFNVSVCFVLRSVRANTRSMGVGVSFRYMLRRRVSALRSGGGDFEGAFERATEELNVNIFCKEVICPSERKSL